MWNKLMLVMKFECLFPSIFTYRSEKTIKTGLKKKSNRNTPNMILKSKWYHYF